jgi:hypothetical protein
MMVNLPMLDALMSIFGYVRVKTKKRARRKKRNDSGIRVRKRQ